MPTQQKIHANRRNALLSTGPAGEPRPAFGTLKLTEQTQFVLLPGTGDPRPRPAPPA